MGSMHAVSTSIFAKAYTRCSMHCVL